MRPHLSKQKRRLTSILFGNFAFAVYTVLVISGSYILFGSIAQGIRSPQVSRLKEKWCPTCNCPAAIDADAALDTVHDNYPPIVSSFYAQVTGLEPYERDQRVPWDLHVYPTDEWYDRAKRATDRCDLELSQRTQGAENGLADEIVWVSGLFDFNRGSASMGDFERKMSEYFRRFQIVLDRGFKMVVFIPEAFERNLTLDRSRIRVIHMDAARLETYFPYWERLQAIRTSPLWTEQARLMGWLKDSPQARLAQYDPLVMSKFFLVRDAARLNPWGARYHLWMDAGHLCAWNLNPTPAGTSLYRRHMASGFFCTHWPYTSYTEVHGFTTQALRIYMAQPAPEMLQIVRGGIFGGTLPYIECVLKAYVIALHQTLTDGYLGTEECIWAIIHTRFPHLFTSFYNTESGDNCASFTATVEEEGRIARGAAAFVSPPVPALSTLQQQEAEWKAHAVIQKNKDVAALVQRGGIAVAALPAE